MNKHPQHSMCLADTDTKYLLDWKCVEPSRETVYTLDTNKPL